jgi:diguanylate cyclase (GGDEF)-like protein/hemerythrin-like metal-binding protein/PAS domain S-box-containing protein
MENLKLSRVWAPDSEFLSILRELPVPAIVVGNDHAVVFTNPKHDETFGYTRDEIGTLDRWWELLCPSPEAGRAVTEAIGEWQRRATPLPQGRQVSHFRAVARDGRAIDVEVFWVHIGSHEVWMFNDVTDRRRESEIGEGRVAATRLVEELRRKVAELEHQVMTDRLTGTWNRRYFDITARTEMSRSRRYRQPLSLVMFDIDHFKGINDRFGHPAGDSVLVALTQIVKKCIRSLDSLVRWGGEEFVLLTPVTALRGAEALTEKLRHAVANSEFSGVGRVTVSLGTAEYRLEETLETWIARADRALYAAKATGRNRAVSDGQTTFPDWDKAGATAPIALVWDESYECGEPTIDAEHQTLFSLANALLDAAFRASEDRGALTASMDRLLAHVVRHFEDEEKILADRKYIALDAHRRLHREIVERAGALKASLEAGTMSIGRLVEFLAREVVAQHLLTADKAFFYLFRDGSEPPGGAKSLRSGWPAAADQRG